jgi:hypothetical protein
MNEFELELPKELYSDDDVVFYIASLDHVIKTFYKIHGDEQEKEEEENDECLSLSKMMSEIAEHRSLRTLWETYMEDADISGFFMSTSPYHFQRLGDMNAILLGVKYSVSPPQSRSYYYQTKEGRDKNNRFYLLQEKKEEN